MAGRSVNGGTKKKKFNKQGVRKKFSARHIDQVWEDVRKLPEAVVGAGVGPRGTSNREELDEDVPGRGQFYCIPCGQYFQNEVALQQHTRGKPHKRRERALVSGARPHSQRDAEAAGGMGAPDNGPRLRSEAATAMAH